MHSAYSEEAPSREQVDALSGPTVLDFGTNWCGYCRAAEPLITEVLGTHPEIRHIKVEDGKGRPLGRSYGVKLWPTLVFLADGDEVARVVRPNDPRALADAVARVTAGR